MTRGIFLLQNSRSLESGARQQFPKGTHFAAAATRQRMYAL